MNGVKNYPTIINALVLQAKYLIITLYNLGLMLLKIFLCSFCIWLVHGSVVAQGLRPKTNALFLFSQCGSQIFFCSVQCVSSKGPTFQLLIIITVCQTNRASFMFCVLSTVLQWEWLKHAFLVRSFMFKTRKRILVFNLLPIDNGPHIQQNDVYFVSVQCLSNMWLW